MNKINFKLLIPLLILTICLALISTLAIKITVNHFLESDLNRKIEQINKDLVFKDGSWDISRYNNNEFLTGSYPLYIILNDGFIVDRRSPVSGYLDTTDFKRLLEYSSPADIKTITGQNKRVLSRLIGTNNDFKGIIVVSYYNPDTAILEKIDTKLNKNIDYIYRSIKIKNDEIDTSNLDVARIDYDIAYSIIDKYNTVVNRSKNVNSLRRNPGYIDPSYVSLTLKGGNTKTIKDKNTNENYYIKIYPLKSGDEVKGVIVLGHKLTFYEMIQTVNFFVILIFGAVLSILLSVIFNKVLNITKYRKIDVSMPKNISFNSKSSALIIDEKLIEVPYSTNQYYFLQAIFTNPSKRWETDELLEKFGEDQNSTNWRKVYDSMIGINKKTEDHLPLKLIINKNKTYQLNPKLIPLIPQKS